MELFDLLTWVLIALCGLVVYFEFLLTKEQKQRNVARLGVWRDQLEKIPIYHVPQQELRFALGVFEYGLQFRFRRTVRFAIVLLLSAATAAIAYISVSKPHSSPELRLAVAGVTFVDGSILIGLGLLFLRVTTRALLKRVSGTSCQALVFVGLQVVTLTASVAFGSATFLLVILIRSLPFILSGEFYIIPQLFPGGPIDYHLYDALFFRMPENIDYYEAVRIAASAYPGNFLFWIRLSILIFFVASWLLAPLTIRFAYLNLRSLADVEKGSLTVAAMGLSAFIKGTQEGIKALLKWLTS